MRGYRTGYPQFHSHPYRYALRGIGEEQDRLPHRRYRGVGVYEDITEWDITQFARTHSPLKIATTYDSLPRVVSALQSIGIDPYKELFLLVDEWHVLFNSYSFRHRAIRELLATAARFDRATYMTATPIEREYMLEELRHLPTCEID